MNLKSIPLLLSIFLFPAIVNAVVITDIYNTGVDDNGNVIGENLTDLHYSIVNSQPAPGGYIATTVVDDDFPIPPWIANSSTSRWIGTQHNDANGAAGTYTYRTTFTLGNDADLATAIITGLGSSDDSNPDVLLNGISLGSLFSDFTSFTAFSIESGFILGLNTLDFQVFNFGGPTGLRIENISGSYDVLQPVSEPSVLLLFALGLVGLRISKRKSF